MIVDQVLIGAGVGTAYGLTLGALSPRHRSLFWPLLRGYLIVLGIAGLAAVFRHDQVLGSLVAGSLFGLVLGYLTMTIGPFPPRGGRGGDGDKDTPQAPDPDPGGQILPMRVSAGRPYLDDFAQWEAQCAVPSADEPAGAAESDRLVTGETWPVMSEATEVQSEEVRRVLAHLRAVEIFERALQEEAERRQRDTRER